MIGTSNCFKALCGFDTLVLQVIGWYTKIVLLKEQFIGVFQD